MTAALLWLEFIELLRCDSHAPLPRDDAVSSHAQPYAI